jgi:hypothetical protein
MSLGGVLRGTQDSLIPSTALYFQPPEPQLGHPLMAVHPSGPEENQPGTWVSAQVVKPPRLQPSTSASGSSLWPRRRAEALGRVSREQIEAAPAPRPSHSLARCSRAASSRA